MSNAGYRGVVNKKAGHEIRNLTFRPLTPNRWADIVELFGDRGACGGCWCMAWRLKRSQWERNKGARNRAAFRRIVEKGHVPGILVYLGPKPIGWCAVAPRSEYEVLERSRALRPIDDKPVWSIVCLFVLREFRNKGVSVALLRAAVEHARSYNGQIVEGYPIVSLSGRLPDAFAWTGTRSAFIKAGFVEVRKPSAGRRVMRIYL